MSRLAVNTTTHAGYICFCMARTALLYKTCSTSNWRVYCPAKYNGLVSVQACNACMWLVFVTCAPLYITCASRLKWVLWHIGLLLKLHYNLVAAIGTSSTESPLDLKMQAGSDRTYQVVVWGATGIVGRCVCTNVVKHYQVGNVHLCHSVQHALETFCKTQLITKLLFDDGAVLPAVGESEVGDGRKKHAEA